MTYLWNLSFTVSGASVRVCVLLLLCTCQRWVWSCNFSRMPWGGRNAEKRACWGSERAWGDRHFRALIFFWVEKVCIPRVSNSHTRRTFRLERMRFAVCARVVDRVWDVENDGTVLWNCIQISLDQHPFYLCFFLLYLSYVSTPTSTTNTHTERVSWSSEYPQVENLWRRALSLLYSSRKKVLQALFWHPRVIPI